MKRIVIIALISFLSTFLISMYFFAWLKTDQKIVVSLIISMFISVLSLYLLKIPVYYLIISDD